MFVLDPSGVGLLLTGSIKTLGNADWGSIAVVTSPQRLHRRVAGVCRAGLFGAHHMVRKVDADRRRAGARVSDDHGDVTGLLACSGWWSSCNCAQGRAVRRLRRAWAQDASTSGLRRLQKAAQNASVI